MLNFCFFIFDLNRKLSVSSVNLTEQRPVLKRPRQQEPAWKGAAARFHLSQNPVSAPGPPDADLNGRHRALFHPVFDHRERAALRWAETVARAAETAIPDDEVKTISTAFAALRPVPDHDRRILTDERGRSSSPRVVRSR